MFVLFILLLVACVLVMFYATCFGCGYYFRVLWGVSLGLRFDCDFWVFVMVLVGLYFGFALWLLVFVQLFRVCCMISLLWCDLFAVVLLACWWLLMVWDCRFVFCFDLEGVVVVGFSLFCRSSLLLVVLLFVYLVLNVDWLYC